MKVKEESEKVGLKLNIQKMKIMASGPITSWKIYGETMETVGDFILRGLQNHCSHLQFQSRKTFPVVCVGSVPRERGNEGHGTP